ncbi:hypothetical protein FA95DRAFT_1613045 [Auriscalpium vulgare]|uniref:Uncharacterized protein n=1 Tax=Auriscalpium vulgare TaxID=40419 RepID=A0ACB8R5G1_9AGAM|nr:hypothetical protein FA95DRAFT_1613045 [Auriscalpium vulgare]
MAHRRHHPPHPCPTLSPSNSTFPAGFHASSRPPASVSGGQSPELSYFNTRLRAQLDQDKCLPVAQRQPDAAKAITHRLTGPYVDAINLDSPQKELWDILSSHLRQGDCVDRGAVRLRYALAPVMTQVVTSLLGAYERAVQDMLALEDDAPPVRWQIDPGAGIVSVLLGTDDFRALAVSFSAFQMRMREASSIVAHRYELHHGGPYTTPARPRRTQRRRRQVSTAFSISSASPHSDVQRPASTGDEPPVVALPVVQHASEVPAPLWRPGVVRSKKEISDAISDGTPATTDVASTFPMWNYRIPAQLIPLSSSQLLQKSE